MKFKIGDRVRVCSEPGRGRDWVFWVDRMDDLCGKLATVEEAHGADTAANNRYRIRMDGEKTKENLTFLEEWLDPIDEPEEEMTEFTREELESWLTGF